MILDPDTVRSNLLTYTDTAFALLPRLDNPTILDAGCGTGVPTVRLAELSGGTVVALDTNPVALLRLAEKIRQKGLVGRVTLVNCAIEHMPFVKKVFDVIWAEGAIAHLGFAPATRLLGEYLKDGGFLVVHDDAADVLQKISTIHGAGFSLMGFFLLAENVWWEQYYRHLASAVEGAVTVRPPHDLGRIRTELEQFGREPERFQSAFFIMRKSRCT